MSRLPAVRHLTAWVHTNFFKVRHISRWTLFTPRNAAITDLELAPRQADGTVAFAADFAMLLPVECRAR